MFGVVAAGRLVDTSPVQTEPAKFVFRVDEVAAVNHLTVFMTGVEPFPAGLGAAVYLGWPVGGELAWQLLGFLTNEKPSAIFRVSGTRPSIATGPSPFGAMLAGTVAMGSEAGQIGISIEPLPELAQQTPHSAATALTVSDLTTFPRRVLESFFNFASSFGAGGTFEQ